MKRVWLSLLAMAQLGSMTSSVGAEVHVTAPASCGSEREFREELSKLIGAEAAAGLHVEAHLTEPAEGKFRLTLSGPEWSRELEDSDCRALFRAGAVIVAAWVEEREAAESFPAASPKPRIVTSGTGTEAAQGSATKTTRSPDSNASTPSADEVPVDDRTRARTARRSRTRAPRAPTQTHVFVGGGLEAGLAPSLRGVVSAGGGHRIRSWGIHAELRYTPPTSSLTEQSGVTEDELGLRLNALGWRLAGSWDPSELLHLLVGASLTRLQARGVGVAESRSDQIFLPSVEVEAQVRPLRWRHFAADVALRGRLGLSRARFQVDPEILVYEIPRWGGSLLFRAIYVF